MKIRIKTALISVSDKSQLNYILKPLKKYNVKIISSGGTYKHIKKLGFKCTEVSEYTKFPEILDGRVKTLHPKIHSGILSIKKNKTHKKQMKLLKYESIDLVIVNFYPFKKSVELGNKHEKTIENIDIGGPAMVRAAAKNYENTAVVTNVSQYEKFYKEITKYKGSISGSFRRLLAEEAFLDTAYYDASISKYFTDLSNNKFPSKKVIFGEKKENLRYGENPHQKAAFYYYGSEELCKLSGKQLSYNNYNDLYSAISISNSFPKNVGTVIVKHSNPCGVSIEKNKIKSLKQAMKCDPISAFGGIVVCNFKIDKKIAIELNKIFLEIVVGKGISNDALQILKRKKNLRIIDSSNLKLKEVNDYVKNFDGFLLQSPDYDSFSKKNFQVVSTRKPNKKIFDNLVFAFNVCRFVKSNAIVITKNFSTIGIGSGQSSRVDSCDIAVNKMKRFELDQGEDEICAASDAFFPFTDGLEKLSVAGVTAVIQPSGSIKDRDIINLANKLNLILIFSKTRHFKH